MESPLPQLPNTKKKHSNFPTSPRSPEPKRESGTSCAACRHQRRRCTPDCILLPYFPGNSPANFARVQKIFGVNNVVRTLKSIPPEFRGVAVESLVSEANIRVKDPVGGCYRLVLEMRRRVEVAEADLLYVLRCIEFVRSL